MEIRLDCFTDLKQTLACISADFLRTRSKFCQRLAKFDYDIANFGKCKKILKQSIINILEVANGAAPAPSPTAPRPGARGSARLALSAQRLSSAKNCQVWPAYWQLWPNCWQKAGPCSAVSALIRRSGTMRIVVEQRIVLLKQTKMSAKYLDSRYQFSDYHGS